MIRRRFNLTEDARAATLLSCIGPRITEESTQ
jgi:hypothetical protein